MAACFQFALTNPFAGMEAEFNDWYGSHHLYVGVRTPGILAGQRFQRIQGPFPAGEHDFLALWELDNPPYALEQLAKVKGTEVMPLSPAVDMAGIQPPTMWIRASCRSKDRIVPNADGRGTCVLVLCNAVDNDEAGFEGGVLSGGLRELADLPGVISVDFLTLAEEQIRNNARKFRFGFVIELSDEAQGLKSLESLLPNFPRLDLGRWKAPVYRPMGGRVTTAMAELHIRDEAHG